MFSPTGLSPTTADHPRPLRLTQSFLTAAQTGRSEKMSPTTPHTQPLPGITRTRFSHPPLSLATTHGITYLFSLPTGTEMFHFPAFPPNPMHSASGDTTSLVPGFPIRTSSDPRSVDSSPRLIAASYVLHRLPVPRHPPCALKHLQHKTRIRNCTSTQQKTRPQPHHTRRPARSCAHTFLAARCSQPLSTNQTPHPTTKMERKQTHHHPPRRKSAPTPVPHNGAKSGGPVASKPNSVSGGQSPKGPEVCCAPEPKPTTGQAHPTNRPAHRTPTRCGRVWVSWCSLERR